MMSNREIEKEGGVLFTTTTSPAGNHHATAVNPTTIEQCSSCGSTKRRSLFSSSSLQEQPIPKKPTLSPPPLSSSAAVSGQFLDGFTKIQLPATILRRRTISEPMNSISNPQLSPAAATLPKPHSPENLNKTHSPAKNPSLPPCNLRRTISDPTPALTFPHSPENNTKITPTVTVTETPTSRPPFRQILRRRLFDLMNSGEMGMNTIRGESPSSKELKKMKEIFRVMSEWFRQAIQQVEEEDDDEEKKEQEGYEFNHVHGNPKEDDDFEIEIDEEAVSVYRIGKCIKVEFKCPCGKGYQILLSGNGCYYKLM